MKFIVFAILTICSSPALAQSAPEAMRIRERRLAQNRAIAQRDGQRAASFWTEDITLRRGLGHAVSGRAAYRKLVEAPPSATNLIYERVPSSIEVSTQWPLAFETGTWSGHTGSLQGPVVIGGKYSAQWVKRDTTWLIRSEVFVALTCAGAGCASQYLEAPRPR